MKEGYEKKKINVLVAADHAGYNGSIAGVGRYLLNTLPKVDRKCFKMILVILGDTASLKTAFKKKGLKLIQLNRKKFDPFTLFDFVKLIRAERIDILHLHQYGSSNFGRIAGKITGVPNILHAHGPALNYPPYQWIADRLLAKHTHFTIAVSEATKVDCAKNRAINPKRILVLPNGIPREDFEPLPPEKCPALKRHWDIPLDSPVVGTITRFHKEKGNDYLLVAAAEVLQVIPNARFLLVGDGPLLERSKKLVQGLGIERNVIFTGFQKDVANMLTLFDIMVIASTAEGYPQVLMEAMAVGRAVIATRVGGIKEILINGATGLLVPPRDSHLLSRKIIYLLKNEQERIHLGATAKKESKRHSISAHIKKLEWAYKKVKANSSRKLQSS
jgi:glycosyltransferase involved in cell wall biosynthesis